MFALTQGNLRILRIIYYVYFFCAKDWQIGCVADILESKLFRVAI